jgi:hypothetical protein
MWIPVLGSIALMTLGIIAAGTYIYFTSPYSEDSEGHRKS